MQNVLPLDLYSKETYNGIIFVANNSYFVSQIHKVTQNSKGCLYIWKEQVDYSTLTVLL
jgi:hypothetical protein